LEVYRETTALDKEVLLYYLETGDARRSCKFAELNIEEF